MSALSIFDRLHFLRFSIWDFSFQSLKQQYGRDFIRHIILRHPIKTAKGIIGYQIAKEKNKKADTDGRQFQFPIPSTPLVMDRDPIVGVGYCMKPDTPACISGKGNHNCWFFESGAYLKENPPLPDSCAICPIRKIGLQSFAAGCHYYIMTSAIDILYDLYLPALNKRTFRKGLFTLCRYSFEPFAIACSIAELEGVMLPFSKNDCADYKTWLHADDGFKEEQTELVDESYRVISEILQKSAEITKRDSGGETNSKKKYKKQGNIFFIHYD